MRIACLGWGSLIWKPGVLPVVEPWRRDGPDLPIDFARESEGGELAAVICETAPMSRVMWALLNVDSIAVARELLRLREKIPSSRPRSVGSYAKGMSVPRLPFAEDIASWACQQQLDGVVWTALPPRSLGMECRVPTLDEALHYFQQLPPAQRQHAELYVRSAPRFIATELRQVLSREWGWLPNRSAAPLLTSRQGPPRPETSRRKYAPRS